MEHWIITFMKNHSQTIILSLIVIFWAIVHATAMLKVRRDKWETMDKVDFFILLPIAMFSWLMFALGTQLITDNTTIVMLAAGAWAFLWLAGLSKFSNAILDTLISNIERNKDLKSKTGKDEK